MTSWEWLEKAVVMAFHDVQLVEHGGAGGVRDEALLDSALARAQNQAAYGTPSVFDLAAAYAFGIAKNHPFIDGNKRTAFISAMAFLELNGHVSEISEVDAVLKTLALASGNMTEKEFSDWLRQHTSET